MDLSGDWTYSILIALSLCHVIECMEIAQKDHTSEVTSHSKYVEKYQLPGGNQTGN